MSEKPASKELENKVIKVLRNCYDPEIPVNIYDLGLVYDIKLSEGIVQVVMTLTSPMCPVAESLPREVKYRVEEIEDVRACQVTVVWDPPWSPGMMSEEARLELNML